MILCFTGKIAVFVQKISLWEVSVVFKMTALTPKSGIKANRNQTSHSDSAFFTNTICITPACSEK